MSASKRTQMHKKNRDKDVAQEQQDEDVNEFDVDIDDETTKQNETNEDEGEIKEIETESENENENESENETESEIKNATVTGLAVYHQQKREYIIASYSDGKLFAFKPNGHLSSSARTIPYKSPNKTIVAISVTKRKYEMVIVTEIGFQFLKLPKLTKTGIFCHLPENAIVSDIEFDVVSTSIMYLGTTDGRLIVYNTKKLNKKMCQYLDIFSIEPNSGLKIESVAGYLLITSSIGLHSYNVTGTKSLYQRPGLLFVRKFHDEFITNNIVRDVLVSSHTDGNEHTLIAYAQSATAQSNNTSDDDDLYNFIVMESYLPKHAASKQESRGLFGLMSKAPIFIGVAMFAVFYIFFKGKGGGDGTQSGGFGNSPLGRLGKIFSRKNRRSTRTRGSRSMPSSSSSNYTTNSRSINNPSRYQSSANARYTQRHSGTRSARFG